MRIVFDTAAFLAGLQLSLNRVYTTQEVIEEIKDNYSRFNLDISVSSDKVVVIEPSLTSIKKVEKVLDELNERKLSKADMSIIALAIDLAPCIVFTDDLSVQNVLKKLGIEFYSVKLSKKIEKPSRFIYYCTSCNKKYKTYYEQCPYCGGKIVKRKIGM